MIPKVRLGSRRSIRAFSKTIGQNVRIDSRWPAGDFERFHRYAAELVVLSPDVILATGSAACTWLAAVHEPARWHST